jgi:alpha-L-rhamnosidase
VGRERHARAQVQTAYQVIVAADEAAITNNEGALWNSGKVASAQQYGIAYVGPALAKATKYWWKVRTWNQEDTTSPWSAATTFVTGFFQPTDWDSGAKWIRHPQSVGAATDAPPMFRKSFTVDKPVKYAFLYVTGLGHFVASLNGQKIGNHEIDPAWTDYDHTMSYVTFDVTKSLVMGTNALGVMLGSGWLNAEDNVGVRPFGVMRMLAQLRVVYDDGHGDGARKRTDVEGDRRPHHLHGVPWRREIRRTEVAGGMEHSHLRRFGVGRGRRQRPRPALCARRRRLRS